MLNGIILNLLCGLMFATLGAILGHTAEKKIDVYSYYFWGSMFAFLWSCSLIKWDGPLISHNGFWILAFWMFLGSMFNNIGHLLLYHNMKYYHRAASWAVAMSALSIPFIAALLFWKEPITAGGIGGLLMLLCGIGLLAAARKNGGTGKTNLKWLGLAIANFLGYGLAQTAMSVPSHCEGLNELAHLRTPLSALFCGLQQFGVILVIRRRSPEAGAVKIGLVYSLVYFAALIGIYAALDILSEYKISRIFWPLGSGTCIVAFTIYSHLVKKEHFSRLDFAGLAVIIIGLLLLGGII